MVNSGKTYLGLMSVGMHWRPLYGLVEGRRDSLFRSRQDGTPSQVKSEGLHSFGDSLKQMLGLISCGDLNLSRLNLSPLQ